jgi:ABC-type multidrug transport system ATPase subunit
VIQLSRVGKRYGRGPWVLRDVDLTLEPASLTVCTGGNGSGKSTLLRIIAGVTSPSPGRVHGRPASVGYLPERFPAGLRLSADAYLRHMAAVRGVAGSSVLEDLGFHGDPLAPMSTSSKGTRRRSRSLRPSSRRTCSCWTSRGRGWTPPPAGCSCR